MKIAFNKFRRSNVSADPLRAGFTLVELLLTMAVLVTVATVAVVPIAKWQNAMPLDQSVATVQQQITATRLMAIDSAATYSIDLTHASSTLRRICTSDPDAKAEQLRLSEGVTFVVQKDANPESHRVTFQPDGTVSDSLILLKDSAGVLAALKVERLTGMVRIVDPTSSAGGVSR